MIHCQLRWHGSGLRRVAKQGFEAGAAGGAREEGREGARLSG